MTYARTRLWLGITGVGTLVCIASWLLLSAAHLRFFSTSNQFSLTEFLQLSAFVGLFLAIQFPLDLLGGFVLPKKFGRTELNLAGWFSRYLPAAVLQAFLFVLLGTTMILTSNVLGLIAGILVAAVGTLFCWFLRNRLLMKKSVQTESQQKKLNDAVDIAKSWTIKSPPIRVIKHEDEGFTGGIIGFGNQATILLPEKWLSFSRSHLATAIARRAEAIRSGSYFRGMVFAFIWNLFGFSICTLLPNAGLNSVAGLATTICGFTLWSFVGLLTLPTLSRNSSLRIDQALTARGMPEQLISQTANAMDQLQDGEPDRPGWIETIFHPVPNVSSRNQPERIKGLHAWNVARTTLFFSWGCMGFLARSVHCNVGRPELWTMLPTD